MADLVDPEAAKRDYLNLKFESMISELKMDPMNSTVLAARALTLLPIPVFQYEETPFDDDAGKVKQSQEEKQEKYDNFLKEYLSNFTGNNLDQYIQDLKINIYLISQGVSPRVFRSQTANRMGGRKRKTRRYRGKSRRR